jgi:phage terminase Nu1 subunit (DNA packaging protein)
MTIKSTCTTKWFANFINCTERYIQRMLADGELPSKNAKGHLETENCIQSYIAKLQKALKHGKSENEGLNDAQLRYEIARADEKELDVAERTGQLVLAEEVQAVWQSSASNFRTRILALPYAVASRCAGMDDRIEIEDIVTQLVEDALNELSIDKKDAGTQQNSKPKESTRNNTKNTRKPKATTKTKRK